MLWLGDFPHRELPHILFFGGGGLLVEDEGSNLKEMKLVK